MKPNYLGTVGVVSTTWYVVVCIAHPWEEKCLADKESREKRSDSEWKLTSRLFECIIPLWEAPSVGLFSSRLNYQLTPFVSWRPD